MPRDTALEALERFRRDGAWSRQVMTALADRGSLQGRDRALAGRLFYGVLQNLSFLDYVIGEFARGRLEPKVRDILRVGAYQIIFMDRVPPRAAVNAAVDQCRTMGYARAAGLVNAVLRRISDSRENLPEPPGKGSAKYLSIKFSHPQWLVEELISIRGYDGAEAVLQADNETTPVFIQTNTLRTTTEELEKELGAERFPGVADCLRFSGGDFAGTKAFQEGLFYVQDPAARMAVVMAELRPGMRVLDACAAPGGKSFASAIAMEDRGEVLARDISGAKLNLVMDGADRMRLSSIRCESGDARDIRGGGYDVVFADVPCSGLGVIRKKPDIRYREKSGLDRLPELQYELLEACAAAVKPGGVLMYSTCTWRERENAGVTRAFLRSHQDFQMRQERTFWPDTDGTDGFYICRMVRKNEI